ncbi:MAG: corrinoid protein-associated methyltransferase CpaM [Candidatus Heimdallarchaeaceae archaeon]
MTFVYMKILESVPSRYDKGINILTLGKLNKIYDNLTKLITKDQFVLDIGCGTGRLTFYAIARGAFVKAIDINPFMLDIAKRNAQQLEFEKKVNFVEMGVAELDSEQAETYDTVMSSLCFSELSKDELEFTLAQIHRILKPQGKLLLVYETKPDNLLRKMIYFLIRLPLAILTFILVQTITHSVVGLEELITKHNFKILSVEKNWLGSLKQIVAEKGD